MPSPTDAWQTSYEAFRENVLRSTVAMVAHLNSESERIYLQNFRDWTVMVNAGKIDNKTPPKPPAQYVVSYDDQGFAFAARGLMPVCAMPPVPPDYSQPAIVFTGPGESVRNVPPGDTFPLGFEIVADDGARWVKRSRATPFGTAYFYERMNGLGESMGNPK